MNLHAATERIEKIRILEGSLFFILFLSCVPIANWMIQNIGVVCVPNGPCLVPVAPGIMAPSGVLVIGAAFVFRDLVHRRLGAKWAVFAIAIGSLLSAAIAPPALVIASATAFLISELMDFAVYSPLAKRRLMTAVFASSAVGLVVDSIVFLTIAFGSLKYLPGQVIGKGVMVVAMLPLVYVLRAYDEKRGMRAVW